MKYIFLFFSILFLFSCDRENENFSEPFYLDDNGITIKARDWVTSGTTGEINGITYKAVDIDTLRLMFSNEEDVSKVVTTLITDMSYLFSNAPVRNVGPYRPEEILFDPDISSWDVSNVTNMKGMFGTRDTSEYVRVNFNKDISKWDLSKVNNVSFMFVNSRFNQPINSWDVSNVTDMSNMFFGAERFDQSLDTWDVSNVTSMKGMFGRDIIGVIAFNQDISGWDVSNVTDMSHMFSGNSYFQQNLNSWNTSKVTNMSGMFSLSGSEIDIRDWDVSNVTNMKLMFYGSSFNIDIGGWDVSNVTDMSRMFMLVSKFNFDLSGWCVTKISSKPDNFYSSSYVDFPEAYLPIWGTCPG